MNEVQGSAVDGSEHARWPSNLRGRCCPASERSNALSIRLKADVVLPVFKHPVALVLMLIPFLDSSHSIAELH
jgi:hypothetical protein